MLFVWADSAKGGSGELVNCVGDQARGDDEQVDQPLRKWRDSVTDALGAGLRPRFAALSAGALRVEGGLDEAPERVTGEADDQDAHQQFAQVAGHHAAKRSAQPGGGFT